MSKRIRVGGYEYDERTGEMTVRKNPLVRWLKIFCVVFVFGGVCGGGWWFWCSGAWRIIPRECERGWSACLRGWDGACHWVNGLWGESPQTDSEVEAVESPFSPLEYDAAYDAFHEDLAEAVLSERHLKAIAKIRERDRDLAVDTLQQLRRITIVEKDLPQRNGDSAARRKLDELAAALAAYRKLEDERASGGWWSGRRKQSSGNRPADELSDGWVVLMVAVVGLSLFAYCKAYGRVRTGEVVVYSDWGDLGKSMLWALGFSVGVILIKDSSTLFVGQQIIAVFLIGIGCWSFWWMVAGAFRQNRTRKLGWISLGARFFTLFLLLAALSKLHEKLERYRRRQLGVIRGVLIPLAVFAVVFNYLVRPMIGSEARWR